MPAKQQQQNELLTVMQLCAEQLHNEYWQSRLAGILGKEHPAIATIHPTQLLDARLARAVELATEGLKARRAA